ncbi:MAG: methyltransferase domain-containing protein [Nanoarchaeota archaeon]|nr:methyltransferase domain-containing protein [DPANN group archaeon]MBL7117028.1 methyltransferase domain-containing protein [Nanoarchaeota archaeon]
MTNTAHYSKRKVKKAYSKVWWFYDIWGYLTESKTAKRVLELASITDGESVLEIAVGTGKVFEQIVKENPNGRNEGLDISQEMLERAKIRLNKYSNYTLKVGDAYRLSYDTNSFDVLINNYMFDLLPEEDFIRVLQEFGRVLKPNGRIIISTMTYGRRWYNKIWDLIAKKTPSLLTGCRPIDLEERIKNVGFKNIKSEYISQNTFPSKIVCAEKT